MLTKVLSLPLILILTGIAALAMILPMTDALMRADLGTAQVFGFSSVLGLAMVTIIGLAMSGRRPKRNRDFANLVSLFLAYVLLPLFLAVPFYESLGTTRFLNAYLEMVSALTTTGLPLFKDPTRLSESLHLWRALVGWLGGLLIWVSASAVLAPMNLGGFEVMSTNEPGQAGLPGDRFERASSAKRLQQITASLAPVYVGLTAVLWFLLMLNGDRSLVAAIHAMSIMATSGISSVGGVQNGASGLGGEMVIFLFLLFALSRQTFSSNSKTSGRSRLGQDIEFRLGLLIVICVPLILFAHHWVAAIVLSETEDPARALRAFWGSLFTVLSFLSTTGFVSADWAAARDWSGLGTPGLVLLGLSLVGGGVATTAGGVKLLRIFALYLNGQREVEHLVHPSSVGRARAGPGHIGRKGAFTAWVFFMMFALSLTLIIVLLSATGQGFDAALILTIATVSTSGPLVSVAAETPIPLLEMTPAAKLVLCGAMVVGRMETLALIVLFTPAFWRN